MQYSWLRIKKKNEIFLVIKVVSLFQSILKKLALGGKVPLSLGQTLNPLVGSMLFVINIHLPYLFSATAVFLAATYIFLKNRVVQG